MKTKSKKRRSKRNAQKRVVCLYQVGKHVISFPKRHLFFMAMLNYGAGSPGQIIIMMSSGNKGDYIPGRLSMFNQWQINFVAVANLYIGGWSISSDGMTEWTLLTNTAGKKKLKWDAAYAKIATGNFKPSEEQLMLQARREYESGDPTNAEDTSLRIFIARYIRNNPKVTVDQKVELGLTVPDAIKSKTTPNAERTSQGSELISGIKHYGHLEHIVKVTDSDKKAISLAANESIEIFMAITEANVKAAPDLSTFKRKGKIKRGLLKIEHDNSLEGKRAWYYPIMKIKDEYCLPGTPFSAIIP